MFRDAASRAPGTSRTRPSRQRLRDAGYRGVIGPEGWAKHDPDTAINPFVEALS
jgi:hypothetical protein